MPKVTHSISPKTGEEGYMYECPGCASANQGGAHYVRTKLSAEQHAAVASGQHVPIWGFNGDIENPTFSPSVLSRSVYGEEKRNTSCHHFVRDGKIEYLSDCTHSLAGQTIDLPEWE